ncbi:SIS domain-containing protein, partial [Paenibacillus koleovorans]|uniref:SIS domain-containing protein n=1 Tax=Paenibacillus koleovorans TaxID=121608 RepID=UPI000FD752F8
CVIDSPLSQIADLSLELPWAFDHSVCQTSTVTNLYTANLMLFAFLANDELLLSDIGKAIQEGEAYMNRVEGPIRQAVSGEWSNVLILADGELKGLAAEGAIALTEIAQVHAQSHHLLDVRHGPIVTVNKDTLVIAILSPEGKDYQEKLMRDIKAQGATIITFTDHLSPGIHGIVDLEVVFGTPLDIAAQGIPFIFIPQLIAIVSAERQGIQPDQPSGLSAWVKL